jgi:membrane-associated protease RseP (regulator of RpoE activity)
MIYAAIALFALSAVLGIAILIKWLTKKNASRAVVYSHGIVAAIALVILVVYALQNKNNYPQVSLILFIIAALFGFYMFFRSLQQKMSPLTVAFIHALLAVGGFVMLLAFVFM